MESVEKIPLSEQPELKELFTILDGNGMDKEKQEIESLVHYIESMEMGFSQVLDELKEVRGQLEQIQDKGVKATVQRVVDKVETKVSEVKSQLVTVKNNLVNSAANAVDAFKKKGVAALQKTVNVMGIYSALSHVKLGLQNAVKSVNETISKIGTINSELHFIGEHSKNIGRTLFGRQAKEVTPHNPDKGVLEKIQKLFAATGSLLSNMEKMTDNTMKKVAKLEQRGGKKPSVKESLKAIRAEQSAKQADSKPLSQEKAR